MYSYGTTHMAVQKQDDQLELTYSNYVRTQDVNLKNCRRRWVIGRSGERGSGISVLAARHDDDDDIYQPKVNLLFLSLSLNSIYSLSLSHMHLLSLSLSLSHTHTFTLTHIHTHTHTHKQFFVLFFYLLKYISQPRSKHSLSICHYNPLSFSFSLTHTHTHSIFPTQVTRLSLSLSFFLFLSF